MLGRYHFPDRTAKGIATGLEQVVTQGELAPGALLPPIRACASELDVNPNTVAAAYRMLRDRGVVETAGRRGTRVRHRPASTPRSAPHPPAAAGVRNLADGGPDRELLPALPPMHPVPPPIGYEDEHLEAPLAELARTALRTDGVPADQLILTGGALDGMERVMNAHLRPGDRVAVEDPGWSNLLDLIAALGLTPVPVALDDAGILPDALGRALRQGAQALVVTSRAQNPTGAALTPQRAEQLRTLLTDNQQVLLVEDDHAAEVAGVDLATLAGSTRHWALVRSVAKAYGPDLRLAFLTGDATTVDRVAGRLRLGPGWVSHLLQRAVTDLWGDPAAAESVAAAGDAYARRRAALIDALGHRGMSAHGRSGLNVWVLVKDEIATVSGLLTAGWAVTPGSRYRLTSPPGIRISIANLDESDAESLADAVAATQATRPDSTTVTR